MSFIHLAVCLTTGPKPLPKRDVHIVQSRASSFRCEYPLLSLTLSQLMLHICGVSKMFCERYQKTNKTEDTNKLTLLAFKIIAVRRQSNNA
jgi:hypothetical protein